ncbi:MAG: hypothetical protein ACKOUM_05395 [Sphingopyxis sp.]
MIRHLTHIAIASAALAAAPAMAQNANGNAVAVNSDVLVERTATDGNGRTLTTLEEPEVVVPGDKLVFVLRYRNNGAQPATNFVVTNPMPEAVSFQGASDVAATVSVDGGRNWGQLATLNVRNTDGTTRPARADEVTHIRWAFAQPIPAGQAGRLMFRGIVK